MIEKEIMDVESVENKSSVHNKTSEEEELIVNYLLTCDDVFYKSQQRGEDEIPKDEKIKIARGIFDSSKSNFLCRFGKHLKEQHLEYFKRFLSDETDGYAVGYYLSELKRNLIKSKREKDVKNRRYDALKKLIEGNDYFSETEMMKRNPLLYEQLVGQYLTNEEKKKRDNIDTKNITFVNLLLESIDRDATRQKQQQQQEDEKCCKMEDNGDSDDDEEEKDKEESGKKKIAKKKKKQKNEIMIVSNGKEDDDDVDDDDNGDDKGSEEKEDSEEFDEEEEDESVKKKIAKKRKKRKGKKMIDAGGKIDDDDDDDDTDSWEDEVTDKVTKWGEFDAASTSAPGSSFSGTNKSFDSKPIKSIYFNYDNDCVKPTMITATERRLLKEEFYSVMYQSFLDGKDADFDYASIDNNDEYDNLDIKTHDAEDKYFDSETPEDTAPATAAAAAANETDIDDIKMKSAAESSEDELDIYMNRLNKHHSLMKNLPETFSHL